MGGSVGGLTAALVLRDAGCEVRVFERSSAALQARGAGIAALEATLRYLTERGGRQRADVCSSTSWIRFLRPDGGILHEQRHQYLFSSWNTIYRSLLELFDPGRYLLGSEVTGFSQSGDSVRVTLADGSAADADLLVCADGVTSLARARLLPDAFQLLGYVHGQQVLAVTGKAVPADLQVGPDPGTPDADQFRSTGAALHVPAPLKWLVDLDTAVSVGMAFRVPLTDALRGGLDRLVVPGLRVRDPATSKADLETLITHQANSRAGFRLLPQGPPTNNTGRTPSAFGTVDETAQRLAALTGSAPRAATTAKSDGQWLAELLGVDPAVWRPYRGPTVPTRPRHGR